MTANRGAVALMDTRIENPYSLNRVATEAKLQAQRAEKLRPEVNRLSGDVKRLRAHLAELEQQLAAKTAEWTDADTQARDYARMASLFARENGVSLTQGGEAPLKPTSEWAPVDPQTTVLPRVQEQPPANLPAWASDPRNEAKLDDFLADPDKPVEPADDNKGDDGDDDVDPPATGDGEQADEKPETATGKTRKAIAEVFAGWFSHKGRRIAAVET